ncbi:MAG: helix-turn-helix transcriptional regulator [bacterium]
MDKGKRIQKFRKLNGLSQEELADKIGISRQAVSKWESNQSTPSLENLVALASIYNISVDELLGIENKVINDVLESNIEEALECSINDAIANNISDDVNIKNSNLTLIALILQACLLNVCLQPILTEEEGLSNIFLWLLKLIPLFSCSIWATRNLKLESNKEQYLKNVKIELLYNMTQAILFTISFSNDWIFLGGILIFLNLLGYILVINPRHMNRTMYNKNI